MLNITSKVKERFDCKPNAIPADILQGSEPVILRGLVKDWPMVRASLESDQASMAYLKRFYSGSTVGAFFGEPQIKGNYFYNNDLASLNFESRRVTLETVLSFIQEHQTDSSPPACYMGSTTVDVCLPGFRAENDIDIPSEKLLVSIWLGNQSRVACHYDAPDNIACVVAGKRRFTLFPPEQINNLYPGPIDFTPAGQAVSLVDFAQPDFEKFPRFAQALEAASVAELEPGDGLFLPSMWWHYVEGLHSFNILINYWWRPVPNFIGPAIDVVRHGILNIRDLPAKEKAAWKSIFDYYVFGDPSLPIEQIPEAAQGFLAPLDDRNARQLRALLVNKLNR